MKKTIKIFCFSLILALTSGEVSTLSAQCPMCKMSAESNMKAGGSAGKGLNTGILYILMMPYLLVGTLGFIWYRNRKLNSERFEELMPSTDQMN